MLTLSDHSFTLLKLCHSANKQLALVLQITSRADVSWSEHSTQAEREIGGLQERFASLAPSTPLAKPLGGHIGPMHVDGCDCNYANVALGSHEGGKLDHALWLYFLDNYQRRPRH
jgi:hypothetical protein